MFISVLNSASTPWNTSSLLRLMALEQQHDTSDACAASALRFMLKRLDSTAALSRKVNKRFNDFACFAMQLCDS